MVDSDFYLERLQNLEIDPNFFVSVPYLNYFEAICRTNGEWIWIEDEETCLFPPLPISDVKPASTCPIRMIWADFANYCGIESFQSHFLDYEYIYDPRNFDDLSGHRWAVFRKNVRRWAREHPEFFYCHNIGNELAKPLEKLVIEWLNRHEHDVQDPELIAMYALGQPEGVCRAILWDGKQLAGINCWDENYRYFNFRVCVCRDEPCLSEFMRFLFYTDPMIHDSEKMVNDGGTLGSAGLELFKDKLNPFRKRMVMSWKV